MTTVKTTTDVVSFMRARIETLGLGFHSDNEFSEYVNNETGEPVFTTDECALYDRLNQECFDVCEQAGLCIYEIGLSIWARLGLSSDVVETSDEYKLVCSLL